MDFRSNEVARRLLEMKDMEDDAVVFMSFGGETPSEYITNNIPFIVWTGITIKDDVFILGKKERYKLIGFYKSNDELPFFGLSFNEFSKLLEELKKYIMNSSCIYELTLSNLHIYDPSFSTDIKTMIPMKFLNKFKFNYQAPIRSTQISFPVN